MAGCVGGAFFVSGVEDKNSSNHHYVDIPAEQDQGSFKANLKMARVSHGLSFYRLRRNTAQIINDKQQTQQ